MEKEDKEDGNMSEIMGINERYSLAKLSEHLTSIGVIKSKDLIWLSNMFNIKKYQDPYMQMRILFNENPRKEILFDFLITVYRDHRSMFPKVMEELLGKFFKNFFSKIAENVQKEQEQYKELVEIIKNTVSRDLEILGYEMQIDVHIQTVDMLTVRLISREISEMRRIERTKLFNVLEKNFKDEYESLKGAYERYSEGGTDAYRQSIDSCRNAYENFFKKITKTEKWGGDLNNILKSKTLISLIKEVYGYLSGYGTHSPKQRKKEDAFIAIRLTEDIMIRVLMEVESW